MTVRYFFSLVFAIIVFVLTNLISGLGLNFGWFLDFPSALIIIIIPSGFMLILHGWKDIRSAFSISRKKDTTEKELLNAKMFFEDYSKILFSIVFIGFIVSFIAMMFDLEVKEQLGPLLAVASISLFYAGIINMVIIIPYKIIINKKIIEMKN